MSKGAEIVIWMPLPPHASWRGEGTSRTIENIIKQLPIEYTCYLVVSKAHAIDLMALGAAHPNIKIITFGFAHKKSAKVWPAANLSVAHNALVDSIVKKVKLFTWLKRKSSYFSAATYLVELYFYSFLQRCNLFLPNHTVIWLPVPSIPASHLLKGKKIYSFWDPFVFEYREFSDINHILLKKLCAIYSEAKVIITQSQANEHFLLNVFQIPASKLKVVHNGSSDYSESLTHLTHIGRRNKEGLLAAWIKSEYTGKTRQEASHKMAPDLINKSILWRLLYKLEARDRILLISTQVRPYKGFDLLFQCLHTLVQQESIFRYQLIFTTEVPSSIKALYPGLYERIHEITRVSDDQHALLYYITDLVLHPSCVEGGLGVYPQFEAASVGTPTLVNVGRHVAEQSPDYHSASQYALDFADTKQVVTRIHTLMSLDEERSLNLKETRELSISWQTSAQKYGDIFQQVAYDQ